MTHQPLPHGTSVDLAEILARAGATPTRTRRDRRGRGMRGMMYPPFHPAYRTRKERFDEIVVSYVARLQGTWGRQLEGTEFAVEEVPPSDPAPWETGGVPLGRYFPGVSGQPARIVVYRRPIEARAAEFDELAPLVRDVIVENVAYMLGCSPHEVDGDYQG
ncbi:metallopeptidase family protein [Timonella senegalensis]|uniref:metallopeptidase family protein n=1 Tax=Timonella senegalensis TaxID=1465825 RepID=UPI002FDD2E51